MSLALTIFTNAGESGVELASYQAPSATHAVDVWDAIPRATEVTTHYLVIMEGNNHIDSKFIETRYVGQLLEMWGKFDHFYEEFQQG
ncbi:hypothetical protein [Vibrio sp. 10N]|uniref:hypothetical protein n=1 Tax=Vibrio sp. 10N TaxID=3058938 RepID=UPI0028139F54|nr:hypothetical protein VB10N_17850 [Vibrio sp. 10N]